MDDTGLTKIEDATLAQKIVERVNAMNVETGLQAVAVAIAFAALPQSTTQAAAFVVAISTVLYLLQDKVPNEVK